MLRSDLNMLLRRWLNWLRHRLVALTAVLATLLLLLLNVWTGDLPSYPDR